MATTQTTKNKPTYRPELGEHVTVGTDATGAIHHFAEHESRVLVIRDGEIEHTEQLAAPPERDRDMTAWIEFVEEKRGWAERIYMTQHEFENLPKGLATLRELMEARE